METINIQVCFTLQVNNVCVMTFVKDTIQAISIYSSFDENNSTHDDFGHMLT
jgi:hypothetical protein